MFFLGLFWIAVAVVLGWLFVHLIAIANREANGDFSTGQAWLNAIRRSSVVQRIVAALRKLFR
jgi:hypothetical protein